MCAGAVADVAGRSESWWDGGEMKLGRAVDGLDGDGL